MVRYPTWLIVTFGLLFSSLSAQVALTSIDPDSAARGDNLSVYIIGQGTNFTQGSGVTSVWFSQGSSTIFSYSFWPGNNTTLTAYFDIPFDALMGLWDISVNSSADGTLTLADAFTVNPAGTPEIIFVVPDSAYQGDYLPVDITGLHTHFNQGSGVTSAWFSQGSSTIISYDFWSGSATTLTAYFAIPIDALIGLWDLSVNSSVDGALTLQDGFRISVPPPPAIVAVYPDRGYQANDFEVLIVGQRTNFNQGSGTTAIWLEKETQVIHSADFYVGGPEYIYADFTIPQDALTGLWDLSITDAVDSTLTLVAGITIFPFMAAPEITNISDVPADQGRWVHVTWNASEYDIINFEDEYPGLYGELIQYGIWELDLENNWVSLGSTPAVQSSAYTYLARTYGDSSSQGIFLSRFKITAHTDDPDRYYTSAVDSGYSVDNLAPAVPAQLMAVKMGNGLSLSWSAAVDEDFNNFRVYRSELPGSDMTGTQPLAEMVAPEYADTTLTMGVTYYYRVSAMDANGNESHLSDELSSSTLLLSGAEAIPTVFALHQNYPNPFNPATLLRYDLPVPSNVNFSIYDLMGREVASLVLGEQGPGFHSIVWQGKDGTGRQAPSGIYIARLVTPAYTKSIKMVLLK